MKNNNFAEYAKELEGMDRIELVLDLLVDKKITKDQAVVLIANDKQIKEKTVIQKADPYWYNTPNTANPYVGGFTASSISTTTSTNPYMINGIST